MSLLYVDMHHDANSTPRISEGGAAAAKRWEELLQLSGRHKSEVQHSGNWGCS